MENRSFSSRGVQQEDVWAAADSLITDGLRPTIERVRQKIGRGSPNTVSPMLEAWFATLASRIGVNRQDDESDNVPKVLQQALNAAWEIALSKGREASALEIVQAQDDLNRATQALNERETELVQMEQVRAVKHQALEEAVNTAKSINDDALVRLSETQHLASKRETEIQTLQGRLVHFETARDAERHEYQKATAHLLKERQKVEERAHVTQHRLLEEIDRGRQEIKKISTGAQTAVKQFSDDKILLEERIRTYEKEQSNLQALIAAQSAELHALRKTFTDSDSRSHELQALFRLQLKDSQTTVARLTEALLSREAGTASGPKFLASKLRRARGVRK